MPGSVNTHHACQANEMIDTNVRKAELLFKAVRTGSVEVWDVVIDELKGRGLFEQVLCQHRSTVDMVHFRGKEVGIVPLSHSQTMLFVS